MKEERGRKHGGKKDVEEKERISKRKGDKGEEKGMEKVREGRNEKGG